MSSKSNPDLHLSKLAGRTLWFLLLVAPFGISFAVGLLTDVGENVKPPFFEAMATGVLPVLLVAAIVQFSLLFSQISTGNLPPADREVLVYQHQLVTKMYGLVFTIGEAAALYAIAAGKQTTFLLVLTCIYGLVLLLLLLGEVEGLRDPEDLLPERFREKRKARLLKQARQHEQVAGRLRSAASKADLPSERQEQGDHNPPSS